MATNRSKRESIDFNDRLVLFKYFLNAFDSNTLQTFAHLNSVKYEGLDEDGNTLFYRELDTLFSSKNFFGHSINHDKLKQYDQNICRHLKHITEKREIIHLKYFQYFSLLFTEIYLDRFFNDREQFAVDLNKFVKDHSRNLVASSKGNPNMEPYTVEKLNKLGFMCATGSGKTLIMHINILQFWHYNKHAKRHYGGMNINKTILLSPNEGMSLQHLEEFKQSNLSASLFQKDAYSLDFSKDDILVIDMNKLKEEGKVKTVSVDSFEQNNLVLIDEAHRGIQGDVWFDYRNRLSEEGGFSFEYSATFKQALKKDDEAQLNDYGKSLIIDYSYKYFYEDGYGKDYRIYNLQADFGGEEQRNTYLAGCLLSFYQQAKLFNENENNYRIFELENPLLVFVGNRVTVPVKKSSLDAKEKDLLTDIEEVLMFINNFAGDKKKALQRLQKVMNAKTNIIDNRNMDIFSKNFTALEDLFGPSNYTPENIYTDILKVVFNTEIQSDTPRLYMVDLKAQGEIGLKLGNSGEYFGVINIGDTSNLMKQCDKKGIVTIPDEFSSQSLFRKINENDSKIRILIGSRKFTEGWNCWRVSTMGLINFAKGEGSQAIQLFGRGVRLHGYEGRLKRSAKAENLSIKPPTELPYLETLTIFGIKADYMARFREYLEIEGLPPNTQNNTYKLATVNRYDPKKKLKVLRVKEGINFKKQAKRFLLDVPEAQGKDNMPHINITLDCRSKVQNILSPSEFKFDITTSAGPNKIPYEYLKYIDYEYVYWQLQQYKTEKKYFNISIVKEILPKLLENDNWKYGIIIPLNELKIDSMEKVNKVTSFVSIILQSYMDKYYTHQKDKWESPYLTYQDLTEDDPNFIKEYEFTYNPQIYIEKENLELKQYVQDLNKLLEINKEKMGDSVPLKFAKDLITFDFQHHLFFPLVYKSDSVTTVHVSPISLNKGEKDFIDLLKKYLENNKSFLEDKDIFLLRNRCKTGIGFFEAKNFYPDFMD
jgi:superfamily II DNA or RNA helicase